MSNLSERALTALRFGLGRIFGGNDAKRPQAWCEYGFADNLCFEDFYRMYERHGIAHGAVQILLEKCWESNPQVIEGEEVDEDTPPTAWEKKFNAEAKRLNLWQMVKQADRRRLVGNYSGLLLQVADNQQWQDPLTGGVLKRLIPAWQGQLEVASWDSDPRSPRYGEPVTWSYNQAEVTENEKSNNAAKSLTVHWTRVVIFGDYRDGVPFLKAGYNDCVTMEKIVGGTGESYLKNAARQISISFDKETDMNGVATSMGTTLPNLHEAFDDVAKGMNRGQDNVLALQGATVSTLVADVPDPQPPFNVALMSFAASVQLPAKVLSGSQTGERASTGDIEQVNKRGQGRREGELASDIYGMVSHLMQFKLLPTVADFTVIWSDLTESSQSEKLANAKVMAEINSLELASGEPVFSHDRIVTTAGFELEKNIEPLPDQAPALDDPLPPETDAAGAV